MSVKKQLMFLHIPKTAGMTLQNIISRNYPKNRICTIHCLKQNRELEEYPKEKLLQISILTGHISAKMISLFPPDQIECFTLLRDPIDRVVSAYHYIAQKPTHPYHKRFQETKPSIKQLIESGDVLNLNNAMVRFLSGDTHRAYNECDNEMLEKALSNLKTYFPIVGLQNDFDTFLLQVAERYNWRFPYYRSVNIDRKRDRSEKMDPDTLSCIQHYNQLDIELFRIMKSEIELRQQNLGPDFQRRLKRFQSRNKIISRFLNILRGHR
jgi:hypothetical protein